MLLAHFSVSSQSYSEQIQILEQKLEQIEVKNPEYIDILNDLAYANRRSNPSSIDSLSDIALLLSEKINYKKGLAIAHKNKGIALSKLGANLESVVFHFEKSIEYAESANDIYTQAACNNNLGLTYSYYQQNNLSIKYLYKALRLIKNKEEYNKLNALINANLGRSYLALNDFKKSDYFFKKSEDIATIIGEPNITLIYVDEYAKTLKILGQTKEARNLLKKYMPQIESAGDKQSQVQSTIVLSEIDIQEDNLTKAKAALIKAKTISEKSGFDPEVCKIKLLLARISLKVGDYSDIEKYCQDVLTCASVKENPSAQIDAYDLLFEYNIAQGNYAKAELNKKKLDQLHSEKFEIFRENHLNDLDAIVDYEKNQQELMRLRMESEHQEYKILALLSATLIVSFLLIILVQIFLKGKANAIKLEENFKHLQRTESDLKEKNIQLQNYIESNELLERFAHVAAHDLKAPMRTVSAYIGLIKFKLKEVLTDDTKTYLNFIESSAKKMSELIEDLLNYSKVETQKLNITSVNLSTIMENALANLNAQIKEKKAIIKFNKYDISAELDSIKIEQIFQNIINNALKFTKPHENPMIEIDMTDGEEFVVVNISDKGIGIAQDQINAIFKDFNRLHPDKYSGTGIGLSLSKNYIKLHNGQIDVISKPNIGSTFKITIPKKFGQTYQVINPEYQASFSSNN